MGKKLINRKEILNKLFELQKVYQNLNKKAINEINPTYADLYHGAQAGVGRAIEIILSRKKLGDK